MRFGIHTFQLSELIPTGIAPEEILARIFQLTPVTLVSNLREHGFSLAELSLDMMMFLPHMFSSDAIKSLRQLKEERAINFTAHLPLWSVEPSTLLQPVREGSVSALVDAIKVVEELEPEMYVLHATGSLASEFYRMRLPDLVKGYALQQFQENARKSIEFILLESNLDSRRLAIETIEFPLEMTVALAEQLDLSICFDTGHVLVGFSGEMPFFEALDACLPRLGEVHLHDGPSYQLTGVLGYGKDHQALGKGDLDVVQLLAKLNKVGFDGPIIFELTVEEALESLEVIRKCSPESLRNQGE